MPFQCNICEQESTLICAVCTKDTCGNHLCGKCASCSDCCSCELALEEPAMQRKTFRASDTRYGTENGLSGATAGTRE